MGRFSRGCSPCQTYQPQECQPASGNSCDSNGCYPSNSDMQAYNNACRSRGGCGNVGDNFQIIRPEANNFGAQGQYEAAVKGACKYTDQNYDQALKDAAAKGQPVVAVFGSKNTPDTQKLLNTVAAAQKAGADGATYVYIDMDRVAQNPNSALAKFVDQNIRGHNLAHTMVFAQTPDANGNPCPDAALMRTWGGRDEIAGIIAEHVRYGQEAMRGRKFNCKASADSAAPASDAADKPSTPAARNNRDLLKEIQSGLEDGKKATDWREGEKQYLKAVKAADQVDQTAVKADLAKAQAAKQAADAKGDQTQSKELQNQIEQLKTLQDAAWKTRMEFGFACMKWNPNYKDIGEQWLMSAGDRNANMYMNPEFRARMKEAGYTPQTENAFARRVAQHELNKIGPLTPDQKRDVGPNSQTPADRTNPPVQPDRRYPGLDGRPPINPDVRARPPINPIVRPEVVPPVRPAVRPENNPEVRPRVNPSEVRPRPETSVGRLTVTGEYDPRTRRPLESQQERDQKELAVLEKAAAEGKILSTAFGAQWCGYCPGELGKFQSNARSNDRVYYSNHDMENSTLAHQAGNNFGRAPNFYSYRVEKVADGEFKLTNVSNRQTYNVTFARRRKAG